MASVNKYLIQQWQALLMPYDNEEASRQLFSEIIKAHTESHRYYHTLSHLEHIFRELACVRGKGIDEATQWSVWFHDIIYRPGKSNNEVESAKLAAGRLGSVGVDKSVIGKVEQFIIATKSHQSDDALCRQFLDADMAILGAQQEQYAQYTEKIRQEFSSVPSLLYKRGRKRFVKSLLEQPAIFLSEDFYHKYEAPARRNLLWELENS